MNGLHRFENSTKIRKYEQKLSQIFGRKSSHHVGNGASVDRTAAERTNSSMVLGRIESSQQFQTIGGASRVDLHEKPSAATATHDLSFYSGSLHLSKKRLLNSESKKQLPFCPSETYLKNLMDDRIRRRSIQAEKGIEKNPLDDLTLDIPDRVKAYVPRHWLTFLAVCKQELAEAYQLKPGEYKGAISNGQRNGLGAFRTENGELYRGQLRDGKRHGPGTCWFPSGALYRGDWRADQCVGSGTVLSVGGEILDCRFDRGGVSGSGHPESTAQAASRIKILYTDGSFYEGQFKSHQRHGYGLCVYPNGDRYEGKWHWD